jgi:hypothetical protein
MYLQKEISRKNKKKRFLWVSLRSRTNSWIRSRFGSIGQRHRAADPDTDPYQNVRYGSTTLLVKR